MKQGGKGRERGVVSEAGRQAGGDEEVGGGGSGGTRQTRGPTQCFPLDKSCV